MDRGRVDGVKAISIRRLLRDWATRASRAELALAFLAAALAGGLLGVAQAALQEQLNRGVVLLGSGELVVLIAVVSTWVFARRMSLDLGLCVVIRRGQLHNREAVTRTLSRSARDWVPFEFLDDHPSTWGTTGLPEGIRAMVDNVRDALTSSVGEPRTLLCVSASDAVGFYLGHSLRTALIGAEVELLTLPTGSQAWAPARYTVGADTHRGFFVRPDLLSGSCSCEAKRGAGILDAARSPEHNPEIVIASLLEQRIICCRDALYTTPIRPKSVALPQAAALEAASFLRARARVLSQFRQGQCVDLVLTCGAEIGVHTGLVLSGLCRWRVWEFDTGSRSWKARWESVQP